jgi:hypothetical protein
MLSTALLKAKGNNPPRNDTLKPIDWGFVGSIFSLTLRTIVAIFSFLLILIQACWVILENFHMFWQGKYHVEDGKQQEKTSKGNNHVLHNSRRVNAEVYYSLDRIEHPREDRG